MILGALSLATWFFQFGKKMVNRLRSMTQKKDEEITEDERTRLQNEIEVKEDQLNELLGEKLRLQSIIENMETNYETFIYEREKIMQAELDCHKDKLMDVLQMKLVHKLGEVELCINRAGEVYHTPDCHHLKEHFSSLKRYRSCKECYERAVRAVLRSVEVNVRSDSSSSMARSAQG